VDTSILSDKKILIVGLGKEGTALASFLVKRGFITKATDIRPAEALDATVLSLEKEGVLLTLGEHPEALLDETDILFVSPGVPIEIPLVKEAKSRKIPLSTETRLFCHLCPAPIMAITGSSGKSTTTTLLGKIMEASGKKTWVGGNIGRPLIEVVDDIAPNDVVVMELSSFQLEYFGSQLNKKVEPGELSPLLQGWSPTIGAILNITPNHLDRHPSMRSYVRAKRAILDSQKPEDTIVLSLDNDVTRTIGSQFDPSKVRWFSTEAERPNGACLYQDQITLLDEQRTHQFVIDRSEVKLLGQHNLSNIMAACLMAQEAGVSIETMQDVLREFTGLKYRLQPIREHNQVDYYNDTIATSPERVMMALRSFDRPIILLAGGRDKKLSWEEASRVIVHKTKHVILFGESKNMIAEVVNKARREIKTSQTEVHLCEELTEAVELASQFAEPGDIVLLSPGCASYDAFRSFVERGDKFDELVMQL
jgi:UDP-N-acetylmuramoylalanine--D-glutamate ligase